jgi:type I restriction enzyme S subunit
MEATINQHIAFITPRLPIASPEFIHLALSAAYRHLRALSEDAGSTKGALTCEDLKRFKVAVPPVPEQLALLQHTSMETRTLTSAITRLEREIGLLREYRTRLVADSVTGKLDVRDLELPSVQLGVQEMESLVDTTEIEDDEAELVEENGNAEN